MRIVYNNFHGRYSDNPRAIYQRLRGRHGTEHVWLAAAFQTATVDADTQRHPVTAG